MIQHILLAPNLNSSNRGVRLDVVDDEEPMTKSQALKASITKWQMIAAIYRGGQLVNDMAPTKTCGLCVKYFEDDCKGCPVRAATGNPFCQGSPYFEVCHLKDMINHSKPVTVLAAKELAKAAGREVDFLISLQSHKKQIA
jgi:hypothetical protein